MYLSSSWRFIYDARGSRALLQRQLAELVQGQLQGLNFLLKLLLALLRNVCLPLGLLQQNASFEGIAKCFKQYGLLF